MWNAVDAVLQTAQGRRAGQGQIVLDATFGDQLHERIIAQGLLVVEILVAQGQAVDALAEQRELAVDDEKGMTRVGDDLVERGGESELPVGLAQQQGPGVGGEIAAGEIGLHRAPPEI